MKKDKANKIACKIYESMQDRLVELAQKQYEHSANEAYVIAFQVGLISDIEDVLRRIK
jgi:hypothetical protein